MRRLAVVAIAVVAWSVPGTAHAGGPTLVVGAAEDAVQATDIAGAKAKLDLLKVVGFSAVRITEVWTPGQSVPPVAEQQRLAAVTGAAKLDAMQVYVAVFNAGSRTTPLSTADQTAFAAFTAWIARRYKSITEIEVGNEPNNNRFWLPQFAPDGSDAAAAAYESLLARTYDAVKAVAPTVDVIGGTLAPRGIDRPGTGKDTHSPTVFINDLVAAYKASGRTLPIMDAFDVHAYEDNSSLPPSFQHPKTQTIALADYAKLTAALAGFDGTAQPGSTLPIVYGEFGVESQIPPEKASLYTGTEPATTKPVPEATQATYYHDALALAFCQPNTKAFFVFHAFDETALSAWQSGLYYADGTPKTSLPVVRAAIRDVTGGVITRCPGLGLTPQATITYPFGKALSRVPLKLKITCDIDCNVYARLARLPQASTTLAVREHLSAGVPTIVKLPARKVAPGPYRFTVRLTAPVNIGPPARLQSDPLIFPAASG
ncbi:MAG TPA: hypothetical protein VLJ76_05860 [Gaiellaceae bacterium]|nr:hypothetical protein [Gaiellaceae bacterium]